jgi:hypothetical protein
MCINSLNIKSKCIIKEIFNIINMDYIKEFKVPKILFIRGIFLKDCIHIDDIFEQQLIDRLDEEEIKVMKFDKIPTVFTSLDTWLKKVNIRCWFCDLNFETIPVFIPKLIEPASSGYTIGTEGCFCTFSCAMAYINLYYPKIYDNVRKHDMLKFLYKMFHDSKVREILASPSRHEMFQYGGSLEIHQYRTKIMEITHQMQELSTKITNKQTESI